MQVGRYQLIRRLSIGGMGEVHLASQVGPGGFNKTVVVKLILPHVAQEPTFVEMFMNEARLAGMLTHPNIVQVFDFGEADSRWYQVMEFVDGVSLKTLQRRLLEDGRPLTAEQGAWVVSQLLAGLDFAHNLVDETGRALQLVHRDVSPDNVLLSKSGAVKLSDFGIARSTATSSYTEPGTVRGKMGYLAPERFTAMDLDRRVDIYAAGIILYRLLTGAAPFHADTDAAMMHAILNEEPRPILELAPSVNPKLAEVTLTAMHRDPTKRFQTAAAFRAEILKVLSPTTQQFDLEIGALVQLVQRAPPQPVHGAAPKPTTHDAPMAGEEDVSLVTTHTSTQQPVGPRRRTRRLAALLTGITAVAAIGIAGLLISKPGPSSLPPPPAKPDANVVTPKATPVEPPALVAKGTEPAEAPDVEVSDAGAQPPAREPRDKPATGVGRVEFRVNPWADVYLNQKLIGTTPMAAMALPTGEYTFVLKNSELQVERRLKVKVVGGKAVTLRTDLLE